MKKVFISHPFAGNPSHNRIKVQLIVEEVMGKDYDILPISPLHAFGFFKVEPPQYRDEIMAYCFHMIDGCDEVWQYGESEGCKLEVEYAKLKGIPVVKKQVNVRSLLG